MTEHESLSRSLSRSLAHLESLRAKAADGGFLGTAEAIDQVVFRIRIQLATLDAGAEGAAR